MAELRFLPRPPLPDMPVHVLDWGRTPPPREVPPWRLNPREQDHLGQCICGLLAWSESLDAIEAEAAARLDDGDWSPEHHAPFFLPRRGQHPDVGWSFTRLTCADRQERWAAEDNEDDDDDSCFWAWQEGWVGVDLERDHHGLWLSYGLGCVLISAWQIEGSAPTEDDMGDPEELGRKLLLAVQESSKLLKLTLPPNRNTQTMAR